MNYIALSIPIFFLLIGLEWFLARRRGVDVYRFNDAVTDLGCGIGQQVTAIFFKGALIAGYVVVFERYALARYDEGSLLPWAIAFVGVDFLYYWWHRASHEVSMLWAVHIVHHQSEDYNLAVALRQAWLSGVTSWAFYLPLAILGVPPLVFAATLSLSTLYQFWIHTRLIGRLGPLELVLNTPSHHRVHHGRNARYLDKNYAATLIVWDRLFGTFEAEAEEPRYGVVSPYASWNSVWANVDFWGHLVEKCRRVPGVANKVRVWLMPPGWEPVGCEASSHRAPSDEPAVRYTTTLPSGVTAYVLVQFIPVVAVTSALMIVPPGSASPRHWIAALLVLATTLAWGALFERKRWAVPLELVRLAACATLAAAAWSVGEVAGAAALGIALFAAGSAVWAAALPTRRSGERDSDLSDSGPTGELPDGMLRETR